jgi:hypothetical protein
LALNQSFRYGTFASKTRCERENCPMGAALRCVRKKHIQIQYIRRYPPLCSRTFYCAILRFICVRRSKVTKSSTSASVTIAGTPAHMGAGKGAARTPSRNHAMPIRSSLLSKSENLRFQESVIWKAKAIRIGGAAACEPQNPICRLNQLIC